MNTVFPPDRKQECLSRVAAWPGSSEPWFLRTCLLYLYAPRCATATPCGLSQTAGFGESSKHELQLDMQHAWSDCVYNTAHHGSRLHETMTCSEARNHVTQLPVMAHNSLKHEVLVKGHITSQYKETLNVVGKDLLETVVSRM